MDEGYESQEFLYFWFSEVMAKLDIPARWRRGKERDGAFFKCEKVVKANIYM